MKNDEMRAEATRLSNGNPATVRPLGAVPPRATFHVARYPLDGNWYICAEDGSWRLLPLSGTIRAEVVLANVAANLPGAPEVVLNKWWDSRARFGAPVEVFQAIIREIK